MRSAHSDREIHDKGFGDQGFITAECALKGGMNEVDEEAIIRRGGPILGVDQQRNCQQAAVANRMSV